MSADQGEGTLIPRDPAIARIGVIVVVYTASVASVLVGITVEANVVRRAAAGKMALANLIPADGLPVGCGAGSTVGEADRDGVRRTKAQWLVGSRRQAGVAVWCASARRVTVGTDGVGGAVPAHPRVRRVVRVGAVQIVR